MKLLSRLTAWVRTRSLAALAARFRSGEDVDQGRFSLTRPFAQSAWVFAAVNRVANPISECPLGFNEGEKPVEDPELEAFWAAPAMAPDGSRIGRADFIQIIAGHLLLYGEFFLLTDDTYALPFPELAGGRSPLIIGRPDRMREIVHSGQLAEWEWVDAGNRRVLFPPDRVIQVKLPNPYHDWRGLAPLDAASMAAGADYASGRFARNVAEANGDQGLIVVAKGGVPDDAQREQLAAVLAEKSRLQQRGIFRPIFLGGDVSIEDPKVRSVDAAFVSQRLENRKEVAAAFGVPPSFFDPMAAYSIGAASDRYILIEETCKPLSGKIEGGLSRAARMQTGRNLEAEFDWDDHSVMQAVRRERVDTGIKLWNTGMPMREVSDYLDLKLPAYPGWDTGYLPFSVAPAADAMAPELDFEFSELPEEDSTEPADLVQDMRRAFADRARAIEDHQPSAINHQPCCEFPTEADLATRSDAGLWRRIMSDRRQTLRAYRSKFTRALMTARAEVLKKLDSSALRTPRSALPRANALDFMFSLDDLTSNILAGFKPVSQQALDLAGQQVLDELGLDAPWKTPDPVVLEFVAARENKIKHASADVFERIQGTIQEGIDAGDTRDEIADRIKAEFNDISDKRARVIANTETAAAHGQGRHAAIRRSGVLRKKWVTSNNQNVRTAHRLMNRYVANVGDEFPVTNPKTGEVDLVMHPGDPNGAPWNVINCHCVEVATEDPLTEQPGQAEPSL